jgi:hypothetical protein
MSAKTKTVSDSTLSKLWRKAVLAYWGYRDPISGLCDPTGGILQCHHVVYRRHFLLRWDYRNGIPLTVESHRYAHTGMGRARVRELVDYQYLDEMEQWDKKTWLATQSMTEGEFRLEKMAELKEVIEEWGE